MSEGLKPRVRWLIREVVHRLPSPVRRRVAAFRRAHATPLHEMLPLPVPETVHVDPTNLCNFRCAFCPTGDFPLLESVHRPKGTMEYELFVKIVDDIRELVEKTGRTLSILHMYKDGEPLIHKRFADMARYAKQAKIADLVSTTTNGSLLTEETIGRVLDSGIDQVRVSIITLTSERYKDLTQTWKDFGRIRDNVAHLYGEKKRRRSSTQIVVKINDTGLTEADRRRFIAEFGPLSDRLLVDSMMGWSLSEAKDFTLGVPVETGMDGVSPLRNRAVCPEPFSRLAINFDGQVSVCCVDWSFGTIVGDLKTTSFSEIWNGEALREFRLTHLRGKRSEIPACANCQYVLGAPLRRELDDQVDRLLPIYLPD